MCYQNFGILTLNKSFKKSAVSKFNMIYVNYSEMQLTILFFSDLTALLLSVARPNLSDNYTTHVLKLFHKLFQLGENFLPIILYIKKTMGLYDH